MMICGADMGKTVTILWDFPPPLIRRLAGSSVTDAMRALPPPEPDVPRTPANAPVPPMTAKFTPVWDEGDPGGAAPLDSPRAMILPTGFPTRSRFQRLPVESHPVGRPRLLCRALR